RHRHRLCLWLQFFWQFQELFADVLQVVLDQLAALRFHRVVSPTTFAVLGGYWFWVTPYLQTVATYADSLTGNIGGGIRGYGGNQSGNIGCSAKAQVFAEEIEHSLAGFIGFNGR